MADPMNDDLVEAVRLLRDVDHFLRYGRRKGLQKRITAFLHNLDIRLSAGTGSNEGEGAK